MTQLAPGARIGIDFDNTLACYGDLFHRTAVALGVAGPDAPMDKTGLRDMLRLRPGGEEAWQLVQARVYGPGTELAEPFPGAEAFLSLAAAQGFSLAVVSHKTRHAAQDAATDLHEAARQWLRDRDLMGAGRPLAEEHVFFEPTQAEKVARIRELGCALFVDDLPEVFAHPDFPAAAGRILFAPDGGRPNGFTGAVCANWEAVGRIVEAMRRG